MDLPVWKEKVLVLSQALLHSQAMAVLASLGTCSPGTAACCCPGRSFGLSPRAGFQEELSRCSFLEISHLGIRKKVSWRVDAFFGSSVLPEAGRAG